MWHDVTQNTPEWDSMRVGKINGSKLAVVMANFGYAFGAPAKKYASEIALGQITGHVQARGYYDANMERGHEEEPAAIAEYESRYFVAVTNGGFYELDDTGCSPDGRVGTDGLIEAKSAIPSMHYERLRKQSYDPAYKWQYAGNLKFSGREWLDFVSYCADYPEGKRIYVYRCWKSAFEKEFEMIDSRIDEFRGLIAVAKDRILNNSYSILDVI